MSSTGKRITREQAEQMVDSWSDEKVLCMISLLEAALYKKETLTCELPVCQPQNLQTAGFPHL
jgi:hypothetical protein